MLATVVDTQALLETIVAAFVAGVGVTFTFALSILGAARLAEANREGKHVEAAAFGLLAVAGMVATLAAIAFGLVVMIG